MRHEVLLPRLGDTVDEVEIVSWEVAIGDSVVEGDPLLIAATDKVDAELPAPVGGIVTSILVDVGATAVTGTLLCVIERTG